MRRARDKLVATLLTRYLSLLNATVITGDRTTSLVASKLPSIFDVAVFPSIDLAKNYLDGPGNRGRVYILPTESISGNGLNQRRLIQHLLGVLPRSEQLTYSNKIAGFFLWGAAHKRLLQGIKGFENVSLTVCGHPRYDGGQKDLEKAVKPIKTSKQHSLRIRFISRFDLLNIFDRRSNLEFIYSARKLPGMPLQYFQEKKSD